MSKVTQVYMIKINRVYYQKSIDIRTHKPNIEAHMQNIFKKNLISHELKFLEVNQRSPSGCSSVILLRPKLGVAPHKHDVISMPTQQCTNTKHISIERCHPVVSIC